MYCSARCAAQSAQCEVARQNRVGLHCGQGEHANSILIVNARRGSASWCLSDPRASASQARRGCLQEVCLPVQCRAPDVSLMECTLLYSLPGLLSAPSTSGRGNSLSTPH